MKRALIAAILALACAAGTKPDLTGKVLDSTGKPVAGATAFIYTAGVKHGVSPFCPSCYDDCGKKAVSDANGSFTIASLDPQLLFRVLVVAEGYKPEFVKKVDPAAGAIEAKLSAVPKDLDHKLVLSGHVFGPDGKPVVGAIVSPGGCQMPDGQRWWGSVDHVDPLRITNARGEFLLACSKPTTAIDVQVEARGLATKNYPLLPVGQGNALTLGEGASVIGKVVGQDDKPMANVMVGIVQEDRRCENYTGHHEIGTNEKGEFTFSNLGPDGAWLVYGIMSSMKDRGIALPLTKVRVDSDGTTSDAGTLRAVKGFKLGGRVVLSDGKPVPAGTRIIIDRDRAWDSQLPTLDPDGGFSVTGIPSGEVIGVSVSVPGYHLSKQNVSLDRMNWTALQGLVDQDIADLRILLEPGQVERTNDPGASAEWQKNQKRRIEGTPASPGAAAVGSSAQ
jgi:protocatechuate 3,4-dioxygenase beta subunit